MEKYVIIVIFIGLCFAVCILIHKMATNAQKLHRKLDIIEKAAREAKTKKELQSIYLDLIAVNKECWHRVFAVRVRVIKVILETKYKYV